MDLQHIIFYCFASFVIFAATMIVTQSNPVRSVLSLVCAFLCMAVVWMLVNAEFLALILILVYVGAVMTLFLFIIMMVNTDVESTQTRLLRYLPLGLLLVAALVSLLYTAFPVTDWFKTAGSQNTVLANTQAIGMVLYTHYVLAFELAAVLLLVAIVAAITLAHRVLPTHSKRQNLRAQLMVNHADRVNLIAMRTESRKDNS